MVTRLMLLVAIGVVAVGPLGAQERVRERRDRVETPRARVWINGDEVDPMQWLTSRRARLGVTLDMQAVENDSIGATISSVTPGGPAAKAGLRSGDIITKLDGKSLVRAERERARREDNDDADEDQSVAALRLVELVAKIEPGDTVSVEYLRGRETKTASVVTSTERSLGMRDFGDGDMFFKFPGMERGQLFPKTQMPRMLAGPGERGDLQMFRFGGPFSELELAPVNADLGAYFGATEGVLVIDAPEKNALGLKGGDVILSVDGRKARGPSSLLRILQTYETGDVMKLEIMRNKSRQTITSKVEKDDDE